MQQERILEVAEALLLRQGIRATTMDQIADRLGISKKTLYEHFPSKDQLIQTVTNYFLDKVAQHIEQLQRAHMEDPLLAITATANFAYHTLSALNPILFREIQRSPFELRSSIMKKIQSILQKNLRKNLTAGIKQGLFRHDLDIDFLSIWMFYVLTTSILNPDLAQDLQKSIAEIYAESILLFLYSFTTESGRQKLANYQNLIRSNYVRP